MLNITNRQHFIGMRNTSKCYFFIKASFVFKDIAEKWQLAFTKNIARLYVSLKIK